ncbi:MAG: hypothetical protein IPJ84_07715 [Bdellovibrionales bacterium]|nr:hypothetical protein [Bdellovibrionales bacterium]
MANSKRVRSRAEKIEKQIEKVRKLNWPDIQDADLWNRKSRDGFTTIPRGLPHIMRIMDDLSTGQPLSTTYFALWCRVFDHAVVTVQNNNELAYESGFTGQRAESTWAGRMRRLEELGFIKVGGTGVNPFNYVLILNPYLVAKRLHREGKVSNEVFLSLELRADQVGADDLEAI